MTTTGTSGMERFDSRHGAIGPAGASATEQHVSGPYRFVVLEGISHWIPETAADRFNEELLAHLAAHPRRA